jgi:hypothetical protein
MARQNQFYKGQFFGLPTKSLHIPFGRDSACKDATGLTASQLSVMVALIAAEFTQVTPVSAAEVAELVEYAAPPALLNLVRMGFAEVVGKEAKSVAKLYRPTAKAWRELGFLGWSLLKEVA